MFSRWKPLLPRQWNAALRDILRSAGGAVLLVLTAFAGLLAQAGTWALGSYAMTSGYAATPLRVGVSAGALSRMAFLGRVGGVAFSEVALPGPGVAGQPVSLRYDPSAPDGERLLFIVGGTRYTMPVPDWELVPIANFANSKYGAVVSLFGPDSDDEYFHATYHPAFQNTLLGMRLLQADMMLMNLDEFWALPRLNGRTQLGLGEDLPSRDAALRAATSLDAYVPHSAQSWVFTDQNVSITLAVRDGALSITGEPYYYFWRSDTAAARPFRDRMNAALARNDTAAALAYLDRIDSLPPIALTRSTEALRSNAGVLQDFNPAVYNASRRTMRYAALFRYVKRQSPASWNAFLAAVSNVRLSPVVETPTKVPHMDTHPGRRQQ